MVIITIGVLCAGCANDKNEINTTKVETTSIQEIETTLAKTTTISEATEVESTVNAEKENRNTLEETYKKILDKYYVALSESWDEFELEEEELSYLCSKYDDMSHIGYAFIDVDKNGVEELFIGATELSENYGGMFFDMYTIVDEKNVRVAMSSENDSYYLCTNYKIENTTRIDAYFAETIGYEYKGGKDLELIEAVIYDRNQSEENPWFYTTTGFTEDCYTSISEKEAEKIFDKYEPMEISYISFTEY